MIDDALSRKTICEALDQSLIVEAAAGTGKTSELVRRIVAVLASGRTTVDRIVAVTFTKKAAGELKLRLRQELDTARGRLASDDPARVALQHAIAHLEEAHVGTIHSFCAELLRERPVEAGVDPDFEELGEDEDRRFFDRIFRSWIERMLDAPSEGVRRALSRPVPTWAANGETPLSRIADAAWRLVAWRDFDAPWSRDESFDRERDIDALCASLEKLAEYHDAPVINPKDDLRTAIEPARDVWRWMEGHERGYDRIEGKLVGVLARLKRLKRVGRTKLYAPEILREEVKAVREAFLDQLTSFALRADGDLATLLRDELWAVVEAYESTKRDAGKLDFVDLLILARNLVAGDVGTRRHLQQRFTHLFIDEFQDTDPLQTEILLLLSADDPETTDWREVQPVAGKLFVVGDPKQSIYRFRRADVLLYREVKERLLARGVQLVQLSVSWRSVRPIQQAVNTAFEEEMQPDRVKGSPGYVPLEAGPDPHDGQPSVVALPVPRPFGQWRVAKNAIDAQLPRVVGAYIQWLVESSGWTVRDPRDPSSRIPIAPRHICLLFRRYMSFSEDVTRPYVRQLEARDVPHVLVGSRSFHHREEVETLRSAVTAIEWPDDELSVYATLRGGLYAFEDHRLAQYKHAVGTFHPFARRPDDLAIELAGIAEAIDQLAMLHKRRGRRPIVHTITQLLEHTRAQAGLALRPAGDQVLANVQRVLDLARGFETSGGLSFRGFVERLNAEAIKGRSVEAPVVEEGAEGVRMMTVHTAKGLEFPVVILCDITANLSHRTADRVVDGEKRLCAQRLMGLSPPELVAHGGIEVERDEAEGIRLAYVAATRAKDLLVVPTVGSDARFYGWLQSLNPALFPERWRDSAAAPGCPDFGPDSVLQDDPKPYGQAGPPFNVKPGLHRIPNGKHSVVWWDPSVLDLDVAESFGLDRVDPLVENGEVSEAARIRYRRWRDGREQIQVQGARPSVRPFTPTESVHEPTLGPKIDTNVKLVSLPKVRGRPGGRRFGTLVHNVMSQVELTASRDDIARLVQMHGRALGASAREIKAAVEPVVRALGHSLLKRAGAAERCHRELSIAVPLADDAGSDGDMLEGEIDLAFFDRGRWTVIDYKTDGGLEEVPEQYRRQIIWYMYAMHRLTSQPVQGILLSI